MIEMPHKKRNKRKRSGCQTNQKPSGKKAQQQHVNDNNQQIEISDKMNLITTEVNPNDTTMFYDSKENLSLTSEYFQENINDPINSSNENKENINFDNNINQPIASSSHLETISNQSVEAEIKNSISNTSLYKFSQTSLTTVSKSGKKRIFYNEKNLRNEAEYLSTRKRARSTPEVTIRTRFQDKNGSYNRNHLNFSNDFGTSNVIFQQNEDGMQIISTPKIIHGGQFKTRKVNSDFSLKLFNGNQTKTIINEFQQIEKISPIEGYQQQNVNDNLKIGKKETIVLNISSSDSSSDNKSPSNTKNQKNFNSDHYNSEKTSFWFKNIIDCFTKFSSSIIHRYTRTFSRNTTTENQTMNDVKLKVENMERVVLSLNDQFKFLSEEIKFIRKILEEKEKKRPLTAPAMLTDSNIPPPPPPPPLPPPIQPLITVTKCSPINNKNGNRRSSLIRSHTFDGSDQLRPQITLNDILSVKLKKTQRFQRDQSSSSGEQSVAKANFNFANKTKLKNVRKAPIQQLNPKWQIFESASSSSQGSKSLLEILEEKEKESLCRSNFKFNNDRDANLLKSSNVTVI